MRMSVAETFVGLMYFKLANLAYGQGWHQGALLAHNITNTDLYLFKKVN